MLTFDDPKYQIHYGRVINIEDVSKGNNNLGIKLTIETKDLQFPVYMFITGDFKEVDGKLTLGSTIKLKRFFNTLNIENALQPNLRLNPTALTNVLGKEFYFIRYKNQEGKYKTYPRVELDPHKLEEIFLKDVENGFIKLG